MHTVCENEQMKNQDFLTKVLYEPVLIAGHAQGNKCVQEHQAIRKINSGVKSLLRHKTNPREKKVHFKIRRTTN